jgi:glutamyl-tRNA reductase
MHGLILVHRKRNGNPLQFPVPIWRTCLREIAFFDFHQFEMSKIDLSQEDEVYQSEEALSFLIEVICGLHSPVLGETEVQGQFKEFLASESQLDRLPVEFNKFSQEIFRIVKIVRSEHLSQLGCHSYGSWVRQRSRNIPNIGIMGSGHLVEEILPWLKKKKDLHLIARNTDRAIKLKNQYPNLIIHSLEKVPLVDGLVIAAPLSDSFLTEQISKYKCLHSIFDFRGESELQEIPKLNYYSLNKIMSDLQLNKKSRETAILKSKECLSHILNQQIRKANLRPGGWEDLCG